MFVRILYTSQGRLLIAVRLTNQQSVALKKQKKMELITRREVLVDKIILTAVRDLRVKSELSNLKRPLKG